ncbi:MAG: porin [Xanthomonadales bacterium]|nr:porin [Xanthomonadales bacterium]
MNRLYEWFKRSAAVLFMLLLGMVSPIAAGSDGQFSYGAKGVEYRSESGNTFLWFGVRLQLRYTDLEFDQGKSDSGALKEQNTLELNRGRLKLGGNIFRPWLEVYTEYDFTKTNLLDLRATLQLKKWFVPRFGQWKAEYNRERIDSSGNQQFIERAISTYWFTVDRQKGLSVSGRVMDGSPYDSSFWVEMMSGTGRGGPASDGKALWLARYQWNLLGRVLPFSQSDIKRINPPAASVAIAGIYGHSRYTRFSGAGGGDLPGYETGVQDQYRLSQFMIETAWRGHGFSWQQEFHWKEIYDTVNATRQKLRGGYLQAGYFFNEIWPAFPSPLELAVRYARIRTDLSLTGESQREASLVLNWFLNSHRNKLSSSMSWISLESGGERSKETQLGLQWEFSF